MVLAERGLRLANCGASFIMKRCRLFQPTFLRFSPLYAWGYTLLELHKQHTEKMVSLDEAEQELTLLMQLISGNYNSKARTN